MPLPIIALLPLAAQAVEFAMKIIGTIRQIRGSTGDEDDKHLIELEARLAQTKEDVEAYVPREV